MRCLRHLAIAGSVALIVGATLLPFGGMEAERIPPAWCLRCGQLWLTDAISNVALFVPLGLALALRGFGPWRAALLSLGASLMVECLQYVGLPPGRSPALADVITNAVGGGLGARLVGLWHREQRRTPIEAAVLATSWTLLANAVFTLTSLLLQPVDPPTDGPLVLANSPFKHVPGHGWYEGITDSAQVGHVRMKRGWSGPIIRQVNRARLPLTAAVWVRSTDPLRGQIPLLFVHAAGDSSAWLQVAKNGNDAELTVYRRAWRVGLALPSLFVRNVFRDRSPGDTSTLGVHARVSSSTLELRTSDAVPDSASLALSPLLGWALIQPVFTVQSPAEPVAAFGWSMLLLAPVGWWCVRSGRGAVMLTATAAFTVAVLGLLPVLTGVHVPSPGDWAMLTAGLAGGALVARTWGERSGRSGATSPPVA